MKTQKPLKRKTPLKAKKGLSSGSGFKKPQKAEGTCWNSTLRPANPEKPRKKTKARGMKGHGRSAEDVKIQDTIAALGCFASRVLGNRPDRPTQIHHPWGRSRGKDDDFKEQFVICLSIDHHNPNNTLGAITGLPSVHDNKREFLEVIGSEEWCVFEQYRLLNLKPKFCSVESWKQYLSLTSQRSQEEFLIEWKRNFWRGLPDV